MKSNFQPITTLLSTRYFSSTVHSWTVCIYKSCLLRDGIRSPLFPAHNLCGAFRVWLYPTGKLKHSGYIRFHVTCAIVSSFRLRVFIFLGYLPSLKWLCSCRYSRGGTWLFAHPQSHSTAHKWTSSFKCHSWSRHLCLVRGKSLLINIYYTSLPLSLYRYGHGFEMFCLASDSARTVVASACKVL